MSTVPVSGFDKIKSQVAQGIASCNQTAIDSTVNALVSKEVSRRSDLLSRGFSLRESAELEVKKIKPNHVIVDDKGNQVSSNYTPDQFEKLKKANEKLQKIDVAIEDAVTNAKYEKLEKVLSDYSKPQSDQSNNKSSEQ